MFGSSGNGSREMREFASTKAFGCMDELTALLKKNDISARSCLKLFLSRNCRDVASINEFPLW